MASSSATYRRFPESEFEDDLISDYVPITKSDSALQFIATQKKRSRMRICAISIFVVLLLLGITVAVLWFVVAPNLVDAAIRDAELGFVRLEMLDPVNNTISLNATAQLKNAGAFGATIKSSPMELVFQGVPFGAFVTPDIRTEANTDLNFTMEVEMEVINQTAFDLFAREMVDSEEISADLKGRVKVRARVAGLTLPFNNVKFEKSVSLLGLQGLKNVSFDEFDVFEDENGFLIGDASVEIYSPSNVELLPLGQLSLDLQYDNISMATVVSDDTDLVPGPNELQIFGRLTPPEDADASVNELFSRFLAGEDSMVTAVVVGSSIPLYSGFMSGITLNSRLPGLDETLASKLLLSVIATVNIFDTSIVPASMYMYNPVSAPITITGANLAVIYQDTIVAYVNTNVTSDGNPMRLEVPGKSRAELDTVDVVTDPDQSALILQFGVEIVFGNSEVAIDGTLNVTIGDLDIVASYRQTEIYACSTGTVQICVDQEEYPGSP